MVALKQKLTSEKFYFVAICILLTLVVAFGGFIRTKLTIQKYWQNKTNKVKSQIDQEYWNFQKNLELSDNP